MQTHPIDVRELARSGVEALRRGDARGAREAFERIVDSGNADASVCLALAQSCRALRDESAALAACDKALALDPGNLVGLIFKGDHFAAAGEERAACSFYMQAVKVAPPANQMPAELRGQVERAKAACDRYARGFEAHLEQQVARAGASPRFRQSVDLLLGKKQVFFQQPLYYYFPELPQIQFYDREGFPWLGALEAATGDIRAELLEVMKDESLFRPYVQAEPNRPRTEQGGMVDNPDWSAFYLVKNGEVVAENAARCPATLRALEDVPLPHVRARSPSVLFSVLRPGARIPAHNGFVNTRLICHLPLIVPPRCGFRVGNEVREWVEGRAWIFDDTIEHEAWNSSDRTRVILLFELWRPELTLEERELVRDMFEAIDARTGQATAWQI